MLDAFAEVYESGGGVRVDSEGYGVSGWRRVRGGGTETNRGSGASRVGMSTAKISA